MGKTKTKAKAKARTRKKDTQRRVITEKEVNKATAMAKRKAGVTRKQLAEKLGITEARAATVLKRVSGAKAKPAGAKAGKACRALVYTI